MILVWATEGVAFALIVAGLLAERPAALGAAGAGIVAVLVVARALAPARAALARAFAEHRRAALAGGALGALALPFALAGSPYWTFVAALALLYATMGQGLNLQIGSAGVINLAGAAFAGLGGYSVGLLTVSAGWPSWLAVLGGPWVAMAVGALLFVPILKTRGHYLALVTIAFVFIFNILLNNLEFTGGPQGIKNIPTLTLFGYAFTTKPTLFGVTLPAHANFFYAALLVAALTTWIVRRLYDSWLGLVLNTIRDDEIAARCSGVSVTRGKLLAFSLGNVFIGLGGAVYAVMVGFVSPDFDFGYSLVMLSVIIIGGVDSIPGVVLGACLLLPLPERFRFLHEYRLLLYGIVIVLMLLYRPRGLWPATVRKYGWGAAAGEASGYGRATSTAGAGEAGEPPPARRAGPAPLLETRGLTVRFGGLVALDAVDIGVDEGETVGIIGPNGSGKTTFFNALTGLYAAADGEVLFQGRRLSGLESHRICRLGISRTFQSSRLCLDLSVFDNVLIGMHAQRRTGLWDFVVRRRAFRAEIREAIGRASHLLALFNPGLVERGFERAGQLPQIDRRRVEICRALASRPRLLLLDEPSAGMNPEETAELMRDLEVVRGEMPGLSIVVIEHDMFVIERLSQRVVAFNYGRKIAEGTFASVAADPGVREAYLGRETARA